MLETNKLHNGDCLVVMQQFPDNSIDHVVCDLPFFGVVDDDWDNQWKTEEDYLSWCESIIIEYNRIIKPNGNIFIFTSRQYNRKISLIMDRFFNEKRIIIWARKRNINTSRGNSLSSGYEPISYYCKGDAGVFNTIKIKIDTTRKEYTTGKLKDGVNLSDVWTDIPALPHNSKEKVKHSTQKPLKLIERIITLGSNPDEIILDNCAGSGTTAIACINLNRKWILIEQNKEHYQTAAERINNHLHLQKLQLF